MNKRHVFGLLFLTVVATACQKNGLPATKPVIPPTPPSPVVHVSGLTTTDSLSMLLPVDSTLQLTFTITPSNSTNPRLSYSSSDGSILKVDSSGKLTGASLGMATVTAASVDNPGLNIQIKVFVVKNYTVYTVGYGPEGYAHQAMVWINGAYTVLTPGDYGGGYNGSALALSGSDLYVAGELLDTAGYPDGCLWKNGNVTKITYAPANIGNFMTSIAISGTETYLAGYVERAIDFPPFDPTYGNFLVWNGSYFAINGNTINRTLLETDTNNLFSLANAMTVSGSDVYVAGSFAAQTGNRIATYWKNDMNGAVPLAGGGDWSEAVGIAIGGGNIYVAGHEECPSYGCIATVKLWTNDMHTVVSLTDGTLVARPTCLAVNDTAEFVGGYQYNSAAIRQAFLWRVKGNNVVPIPLSTGVADAVVNGIAVAGNDVFLVGYEVAPGSNVRAAVYWRVYGNVVSGPVKLPTGLNNGAFTDSEANAILVK